VLRDWAASNTYAWTPTVANANYKVAVWAHSAGTPAGAFEAGIALDFPIAAATITALTADKTSPQPPGTTITFTATSTGGTAPHQYRWWVWNGAAWTIVQDWNTSNTYTWTPATSNPAHQIAVWVRSAGSSSSYEDGRAMAFAIQAPPLTVLLTSDKSSPQPAGTPILFTATPSGGTAPYQYKWWVRSGGVWTVLRDWAASNVYTWTPTSADATSMIAVWAHSAGTPTDAYETGAAVAFPITP
jgi:hypothetical protein